MTSPTPPPYTPKENEMTNKTQVEYAKPDPRFNKYVDETDREWLRRVLREVHGIITTGDETTGELFHLSPSHVCFDPACGNSARR
jgi:hypothetical protein